MSSIQAKLAELWCETLLIDQVSEEDNFFRLGGDSLAAESLVTLIDEQLGINIDAAAIFMKPKFSDFCRWFQTLTTNAP